MIGLLRGVVASKIFSSAWRVTTMRWGSVFADPTRDTTFKMLFADERSKPILISAINSLLDFKGGRAVKDVDILTSELSPLHIDSIRSSLDVRCLTNDGDHVLVEMQRNTKNYFLSRTQYYMARDIATNVESGEGHKYHEMPNVYMLAISKEGLFTGKYRLEGDEGLYEKTIVPTVVELGLEVPGNKMHWKFYELHHFAKQLQIGNIKLNEAGQMMIKDQWLKFLCHCSDDDTVPEDVDNVIKKAYEIMRMSKWEKQLIEVYHKAKVTEQDEIYELEERIAEGEAKGKAEGKLEGKAEGEAKGRIDKLLSLKKYVADKSVLSDETGFTDEQLDKILSSESPSLEASKCLGYEYDLMGTAPDISDGLA